MQIALTKKLSEALELKLPAVDDSINPIFSWTANWTKVWDNRRTEDMIVLVNNATRFTVAIYQVKRKDLKKLDIILKTAITNTLLHMNVNPEIVETYMQLAGELEFKQNRNRQMSAWVSSAGLESSFHVGSEYNGIDKMFCDTLGVPINYRYVNTSKNREDAFMPYKAMLAALTKLTGLPAYKYRAFEFNVTLNLEIYQAVRRIIVPADLEFTRLHKILQNVFNWKNYHLYDFSIFDDSTHALVARLVPFEDDLEYDELAILMQDHTLAEFFPEHKSMLYTYDMGDNWEHVIELVRVIEDHNEESPYLLEGSGQAPPEDVGGVGGYVDFYEIIQNPSHPQYKDMKAWVGYWSPELSSWEKGPRVIHR
jgi:hypothetical protein